MYDLLCLQNARVADKYNCVRRFEMGLFDTRNPNSHTSDVTSPEHTDLAKDLSAASHVLLKNDKDVLPLSSTAPQKIALIGQAVRQPIVSGGGSGRVIPKHVVTPYEGILSYLGITDQYPVSVKCSPSAAVVNMTIAQGCWPSIPVNSLEDCALECAHDANCHYYGYKNHNDEYAWCTLYPTDYMMESGADGTVLGSCTKVEGPPQWQCNENNVCVATADGSDLDGIDHSMLIISSSIIYSVKFPACSCCQVGGRCGRCRGVRCVVCRGRVRPGVVILRSRYFLILLKWW